MHRPRCAIPALCRKCYQIRTAASAATALKPKPNVDKWARSDTTFDPSQWSRSGASTSPDTTSRDLGKWARPAPPSPPSPVALNKWKRSAPESPPSQSSSGSSTIQTGSPRFPRRQQPTPQAQVQETPRATPWTPPNLDGLFRKTFSPPVSSQHLSPQPAPSVAPDFIIPPKKSKQQKSNSTSSTPKPKAAPTPRTALDRDTGLAPHQRGPPPHQQQAPAQRETTNQDTPAEPTLIYPPEPLIDGEELDDTEEGRARARRTREEHHRRSSLLNELKAEETQRVRYVKNNAATHQLAQKAPRAQSRPRTEEKSRVQETAPAPPKKVLKGTHGIQMKSVAADVYIPSIVSVGALAQLLNIKLEKLQRRMVQSGMQEETSYDHVLTSDYAVLLAEEFGRHPIVNDEMAFNIYPSPPYPNPSQLPLRPPVVTIMGHVDHGKTTLLDSLRSASVAKGEAGGITQHIGAFSVPVPGAQKTITFLDTPGHAAFSAMRARGASCTDIVVLVVAADDGVMPQTKEVIKLIHQDKGNVGVVVALNKVDKPGADIELVQTELMAEGIQLESMGGDVPSVAVSGLTGQGLPDLVETLSAMAEMQDLRAEQDGRVHGYVLESKVQKGLGAVATVLVLRGSLKPGAHIISGVHSAKVRIMTDSSGKAVKVASPGTAVTVSGWKSLPDAGDDVLEGSENDVKKAVANRERKAELEASIADVDAINTSRRLERERREMEATLATKHGGVLPQHLPEEPKEEGPKELRLIVKADVSGSAEAVVGALQMGNQHVVTKVISSGVGDVSESDIMLAKTAGGMIVAFSVAVPRSIQNLAAQNQVPLASSNIIYRLMEDVKERVIDILPKVIETTVTGEATVLELFDIKARGKSMKVAGCRVTNGLVQKSKRAKVIRDGVTVYEGTLDTLRQGKKDADEIRKGSECGLSLHDFSDIQAGDSIQMYSTIEKRGVL